MDLPITSQNTGAAAIVSENRVSETTLRRRGAVLAGEALADWPGLRSSGRGLVVSGLPGTLVLLDGLRLAPAAAGQVDLSVLPLAVLDGARMSAGAAGAAHGAGALSGLIDLQMAAADGGGRALAAAGGQAGRAIGAVDLRLGDDRGWLGGGFTQGGALPGIGAALQRRWHLAGRFQQAVGDVQLWGRGLFASRRGGGSRADWHDVALGISGGTHWQWRLAAARGGQGEGAVSSRLGQARAAVSGATGLILPGAAEPISVTAGAEWRRLRLGPATVRGREIFAEAAVPILQDKPAAENLVATLGVRQAWLTGTAGLAGRSETLWQTGLRWEAFPGIALRGQVARGIDDLATASGMSRSIGLIATPAFVPGFALTLDRRLQSVGLAQGLARVQAVDVSVSWRGRVGADAQLALSALAVHHDRADFTPLPVPRFASLVRATLEIGAPGKAWAFSTGWRHRSALAGGIDVSVERQLGERLRVAVSVSNAGDARPAGRQALLQVVAGF